MTLWAGRVGGELHPAVWEFLRVDDAELLPYDCEATALHAERLAAAGILSAEELDDVRLALRSIAADGVVEETDEDVHSAIERLLGPLGRKIHAGRSRNDQVAAAFRLYVADACAEADDALVAFARSAARARRRRGGDAATRLHPSPAGAAGDRRSPPAGVG